MRWRSRFIGDFVDAGLADVQTGPFGTQLRASDYVADGTPVINVRNIGYGDLRAEKIEHVAEQTTDRLSQHLLQESDIVFGRKGAVDRHLFVANEQENWMQGSDCIRLRFSTEKILPRFVSYAFLRNEHRLWMLTQSGNKATMASLNEGIINRIALPLPPRPTQEAIVSTLSAYDDLMENNRRRMVLLEESARLLYREWFVRLRFPGHEHARITNGIPEGWERRTLGDICIDLRETVSPDALEPDTPYIGLEHIPRRSISLTEWGTAEAVTSTKLRYKAGDILFGKIRPYFHKVGIAFTDGVASSDAIVIRANTDELRSLVLMVVSSDEFVAEASQTMREGSKMPRADWKHMIKYPVALPPPRLLADFTETVTAITDQLRNLCFQNQKLRAARDLLLPKLMSGEISV
ncbi:MAG: restriction endonuclease subunit S [Verrucomicrobiota bacterium]